MSAPSLVGWLVSGCGVACRCGMVTTARGVEAISSHDMVAVGVVEAPVPYLLVERGIDPPFFI
jgi:hypothetical protein